MRQQALGLLVAAGAFVLLTACGEGEVEETPPAAPALRNEVEMIEPPAEDEFLRGLQQREPERMVEFSNDDLVELGMIVCNMSQGYVNGTSPNPTDELEQTMIDRGYDAEVTEGIASDIRNAASGTLCTIEHVEVGN